MSAGVLVILQVCFSECAQRKFIEDDDVGQGIHGAADRENAPGYALVSAKTHAVIKGKSGTHVLYALQTLNEDKCFV